MEKIIGRAICEFILLFLLIVLMVNLGIHILIVNSVSFLLGSFIGFRAVMKYLDLD